MPVSHSHRRDEGFTLIELLVAIVLLGIIIVPLSSVVIGYLLNSGRADARLNESHDEQIAAAYWQQDVSSIGVRDTTFNSTTHTFPLSGSGSVTQSFPCSLPAAATTQIVLSWTAYSSAGAATGVSVDYATINHAADSGKDLIRLQCSTSSGGSSLTSTTNLAYYLSASPTCSADSAAFVACTTLSGITPSTLDIKLAVADPSNRGLPYSVTLTGQRRQTTP
jgi:prepilin-type N-terminal cleavage/methylation domain-containing protein